MDHRTDETTRRVFMTIGSGVTGASVARYIAAITAARPEFATWDWIQDVRDSSGEVDNADIEAVARTFGRTGPCWTVFVSHDLNLRLWCRVMDGMFEGRRHLTAATPEAAIRALEGFRSDAGLVVA